MSSCHLLPNKVVHLHPKAVSSHQDLEYTLFRDAPSVQTLDTLNLPAQFKHPTFGQYAPGYGVELVSK